MGGVSDPEGCCPAGPRPRFLVPNQLRRTRLPGDKRSRHRKNWQKLFPGLPGNNTDLENTSLPNPGVRGGSSPQDFRGVAGPRGTCFLHRGRTPGLSVGPTRLPAPDHTGAPEKVTGRPRTFEGPVPSWGKKVGGHARPHSWSVRPGLCLSSLQTPAGDSGQFAAGGGSPSLRQSVEGRLWLPWVNGLGTAVMGPMGAQGCGERGQRTT